MILARNMASRRIAAGVRPSFVGAWGWIVADMLIVFVIQGLIYPTIDRWVASGRIGEWAFIPPYFVLPLIVLSGGIMWARRSRGQGA